MGPELMFDELLPSSISIAAKNDEITIQGSVVSDITVYLPSSNVWIVCGVKIILFVESFFSGLAYLTLRRLI